MIRSGSYLIFGMREAVKADLRALQEAMGRSSAEARALDPAEEGQRRNPPEDPPA